jgi:hypothetical protein
MISRNLGPGRVQKCVLGGDSTEGLERGQKVQFSELFTQRLSAQPGLLFALKHRDASSDICVCVTCRLKHLLAASVV